MATLIGASFMGLSLLGLLLGLLLGHLFLRRMGRAK
jgi:hypothetical protein